MVQKIEDKQHNKLVEETEVLLDMMEVCTTITDTQKEIFTRRIMNIYDKIAYGVEMENE